MCTSIQSIFTWVGALLVNIGFVAIISWGASTLWPLGAVLCALYTACLLALAQWCQTHEEELSSTTEDEAVYHRVHDTNVSLTVNLLYALAVISLGVTGGFLPINLLPACDYRPSDGYEWATNTTGLSTAVKQWIKSGNAPFQSFGYVPKTGTTLFQGSQSGSSYNDGLWTVDGSGNPPALQSKLSNPSNFCSISDDAVCFMAHPKGESQIWCSDGLDFRSGTSGNLGDLFCDEGLVWFQKYDYLYSGKNIYSMDPDTMIATSHSHKVKSSGSDSICGPELIRKQAVLFLFASNLPVLLSSIAIWQYRKIPSMALTVFIGATAVFMCLYLSIKPELKDQHPWDWWGSLAGMAWVLVMTYYRLTIASTKTSWGLAIGAISFVWGTVVWLPLLEHDTLLDWILLNILVFLPLIIAGMVNENMFVLALGGIGLLVDAARFADFVGRHIGDNARGPVSFLVFSLTGLMVGAAGFQLTKWQPRCQEIALSLIQTVNDRWIVIPQDEESERYHQTSLVEQTTPYDSTMVEEDEEEPEQE